jgi:hypothetical protein
MAQGYRSDLDTRRGLALASERTIQQHRVGRAYRFTNSDRRKGHLTQQQRGRFGKGRFRP